MVATTRSKSEKKKKTKKENRPLISTSSSCGGSGGGPGRRTGRRRSASISSLSDLASDLTELDDDEEEGLHSPHKIVAVATARSSPAAGAATASLPNKASENDRVVSAAASLPHHHDVPAHETKDWGGPMNKIINSATITTSRRRRAPRTHRDLMHTCTASSTRLSAAKASLKDPARTDYYYYDYCYSPFTVILVSLLFLLLVVPLLLQRCSCQKSSVYT